MPSFRASLSALMRSPLRWSYGDGNGLLTAVSMAGMAVVIPVEWFDVPLQIDAPRRPLTSPEHQASRAPWRVCGPTHPGQPD